METGMSKYFFKMLAITVLVFTFSFSYKAIAGVKTISDIGALGRKMPITFTAFIIGAFGMCGAPPLAGFISKWHIAAGAIETGQLFFLIIICLGSLLDVVYFFPVIREAFFAKMRVHETLNDEEPKVDHYTEKPVFIETRKTLYLFMVGPVFIGMPDLYFLLHLQKLHILHYLYSLIIWLWG